MKKSMWFLIAGIIIFLTIIGLIYFNNQSPVLPDSVKLRFSLDATSSGGNRNFQSTLNFIEGKLIEGSQVYDYSGTTGIENHYECIVNSATSTWMNKTGNVPCEYDSSFIPLNLNALREKISSGEIKPSDECVHREICYEILA